MADLQGAYWDAKLGYVPARYKDMGDGTYALVASTTPGAGGGGTAQLAVRDAGNSWQDVGYFAGDQSVPVTIVGGAAGGGAAQTQVRNAADTAWDNVGPSAGRSRMPHETYVGTAAVDPRSIRTLTSADVVDVSDRAARLVGHVTVDNASLAVTGTFWQVTQPVSLAAAVDVSDRGARLLGVVDKGKVWDGTNIVAVKAGAIAVNADNPLVVTVHPLSAPTTTQPVSIAAAIDVSDRAARLVGVVYGSQAQQLKQTATNFNAQVEVAVGGTLIDPRSIRTLTSADVVDVSDRAAREVGRTRIWDGTDEATVLPVRTQPATTEKTLLVASLPTRLATYQTTTITVAPAITIGVKEMLALWYTGGTKDIYIVEIWVSGLVTTASTTGGRTTVRVSTITTAPTGGTEEAKVDIAGGGVSAITNTMRVKTGGGAIGSTFIRREVWHATQAIGSAYDKSIFTATGIGDSLVMRGGSSSGFSIDIEREVAHTALVDSWTVGVRWLEL